MNGRGNVFSEGKLAKKTKKQAKRKGKKGEEAARKMTIGQKLRCFNILFPWFKVVGSVMVILGVGFVAGGVLRHGHMVDDAVLRETNMVNGEVEDRSDEDNVEVEQGEATVVQGDEPKDRSKNEGHSKEPRLMVGYVKSKPTALLARVPENKKLIALTFDDGPSRATTPRLLDILKEKKVKATFFVLGGMAQASPEILKRQEQEGHAVGSHTMGHVNLTTLDEAAIQQDATVMNDVFKGILGRETKLVRPPYGAINDKVKAAASEPLVIWTIDPEDWCTKNAEAVRKHVVEKAFDGAIVLMHDIYDSTVDAVAAMIDDLRGAGYEFVTVPEMAQARGFKLTRGEVYGSFRP